MWGQFLAQRAGELALLAGMLVLSAFFSGSETALFSLTPGQLYRLRRGRAVERAAAALMAHPQQILLSLLLGNLVVNTTYATVSAVLVIDAVSPEMGLSPWLVPVVSVTPLMVLILAGEVVPKMLALLVAEGWALAAAGPLTVVKKVLLPLIMAMHKAVIGPLVQMLAPRQASGANIDSEELGALLDLSAKRGILDTRTNALLQEIVELTNLRVAEIMVPRVDMICYDIDAPRAGLIRTIQTHRLRRVPVYQKDVDHILGVVQAKRVLLSPDRPLREMVVPVPFVPQAANLERTLLQLRVKRSQLAVVVDEYGGTAGLVTLEDILEEVVGDIPDRHDNAAGPPVQKTGPGRYVIDGDLGVHEWDDVFGTDLRRRRISTVGGFVTSLLGRIPAVGDTVQYRNLYFTVLSMRRRRIEQLQLELREVPQ
jgi:CBS domain containing-hemolysin-like protein